MATLASWLVTCALLAIAGVVTADNEVYDPTEAMNALYYAKAAYCSRTVLPSWTCGSCAYHPKFTNVTVLYNSTAKSQAYTGFNPESGHIVVAFRGSANLLNWIYDLDFFFKPYPNASCNCSVHSGFLAEYQSYQSGVRSSVAALSEQFPEAPILVTGHSLGAAVSILGGLDLVQMGMKNVTVYNFGEPRVGDPTFAAWATTQFVGHKQFRVTHALDPVPLVPPPSFGYLHSPHELWYNNNGNTSWADCHDTPHAEDPKCSDSIRRIEPSDHRLYLGVPATCSMTEPEEMSPEEYNALKKIFKLKLNAMPGDKMPPKRRLRKQQ